MIAKRIGDLVLALLLLVPATFATALAAVAIRIESAGSPLFVQRRVGRDRREFRLLKLRTMRAGTPEGASHEVGQATVTRIGRILRITKIDELPQVWSVLVGDMSFVGPRPCLPIQRELVAARDRLGVFAVRPGITGLAQVSGVDMSDPNRLAELDARYVHTRTARGDMAIILATATGKGLHDAASGELRVEIDQQF